MNINRFYISKIVFKHIVYPRDYILYTYCIDATDFKEAYQKVLVVASQQFAYLNSKSKYSFVGLQELTMLNGITEEHQQTLISDNISDIDEFELKSQYNEMVAKLSELVD